MLRWRLLAFVLLPPGLAAMSCPRDEYEAWIAPNSNAQDLTVVFGNSHGRERPVHWESLVVFRFDARDERIWGITDTSNAGRGTKRSRITLGRPVPATEVSLTNPNIVPGCYSVHARWQQNDLRFRVDSAGRVQVLPDEYDQQDEVRQPHRLMSCLIMTSPNRTR